jgi:hypothetical protein
MTNHDSPAYIHWLLLLLAACDAELEATDDLGEPLGGACEAEIRIGLYASDACDGEPLMIQTMVVGEACNAWNHGERENSASRLQCWRDRVCLTQYVDSGTCAAEDARIVVDKQVTTSCKKDETPNIYTKILGGSEDCPEAPADFACPISAPGEGTPELAVACGE